MFYSLPTPLISSQKYVDFTSLHQARRKREDLGESVMPKKTLADLRQKQQGVLNYHSQERTDIYWRFISGFSGGQPPLQAPQAKRATYTKLATTLSLKVLRRVVENTVGDVVQLVGTLPRRWLESYTVTAVLLLGVIINIDRPHQGVQFSNQKPHWTCLKSFFPLP